MSTNPQHAPLDIVLVYDFGWINGGAAQVVITEALELAARGHRVTYLCAVKPVDNRLAERGVKVVCTDQPDLLGGSRIQAGLQGIWNAKAARAMRGVISELDPTRAVVHVHGWTKALSASIFSVLARAQFPYVVTLHDYFTVCPNGGLYDYPRRSICTRKPMGISCVASNCDARRYSHKVYRVVRHALAQAVTPMPGRLDDVIYITPFSRSILQPQFGETTRWHYVPNAVDVDPAPPVTAHRNESFIFVGRVAAEKGAALFCQAVSELSLAGTVVGDGPLLADLRRRWTSVNFVGWKNRADVLSAMNVSRALVFPSELYETHGLVVAEAMARGLPVVVPTGTAAADAVEDGVDGLLFERGSASSLKRALSLLKDDQLVRQLGGAAYSHFWSESRDISAHCAKLENVYRAVIVGKVKT